MKKIKFTDVINPKGTLEKPRPASEYIPEWYKKSKSYLNESGKKVPSLDGFPTSTIKRCMPLWDMMTAGYIIETPYDIYVRQTPEGPLFQWGYVKAIEFQPKEQLQDHPWFKDEEFGIRILHPWSIKTPKGWSVFILQPTHRDNLPLEVIPGIIDTDMYSVPTNVFIKLTDKSFEGLIPKGTPLIQVIPFKRESWISSLGKEKERNTYLADVQKLGIVFFDKYKKFFWQRKVYK